MELSTKPPSEPSASIKDVSLSVHLEARHPAEDDTVATFDSGPLGLGISPRQQVMQETSVDAGSQASTRVGVEVGNVISEVAGRASQQGSASVI